MFANRRRGLILLSVALLTASLSRDVLAILPPPLKIASGRKALVPIVVAKDASPRIRAAAATLADYLQRISGAKFQVIEGDQMQGLLVGLAPGWEKAGVLDRENYYLNCYGDAGCLWGMSELAVEHAVWDFLGHLGYRQFFPGKNWEVVPHREELSIMIRDPAAASPDYHARSIWYGYGPAPYAREAYADWCAKNRAVQGIQLRSGHAYDGILHRHKSEFAAHPEYLGLLDGERKSTKFCISNPGLRKLAVDDALAQFAADSTLESVSVDPSDGGGWCECQACAKLGSVSDRAVTLANEVADAVRAKYGDKFVGMYAYNYHAPPPSIRVHPGVVISVATAFIKGDFTVEQLMAGWQKAGATVGIREYYSVHPWDRDLPGHSRGSNLEYLRTTIPQFYKFGARFLSAESSDNWGPNGLGYYLAARMLWNVNEAKNVDALVDDFLEKSFGPAKEPMTKFYRLIDGGHHPLLSDDLVGRMYRFLAEAGEKIDDPAIRARLDDLVLYTGYVDKWMDYQAASGPARQEAFEKLLHHCWRMRESSMVHTVAMFRDVPHRDKSIHLPEKVTWQALVGKNLWKEDLPFTRAEVDELLAAGIARRKLLDFTPVAFSRNLVPAARLKLKPVSQFR